MNKGDLAESAEISRVSISKYFSGKRSPSPKTVGKIAKALNVPVSDIIENATAMADNAQWGIPKKKQTNPQERCDKQKCFSSTLNLTGSIQKVLLSSFFVTLLAKKYHYSIMELPLLHAG